MHAQYGGQVMMRPHDLGLVKEGYLADLLLVDGDPLANLWRSCATPSAYWR